ncbi:ABC transporter permease [Streptomyces sp. AJS327]|uniref:ABC transporter permease n=1 Tax=Streptomyces sp. AJS327 TaxID=2545265 RepID=UPI0015DDD49A|nr:ABC transporter permease [Streptomyces sp. AJS327]MBA0053733.1 ABC transporter permease [Streptomyces sp. AJS327]
MSTRQSTPRGGVLSPRLMGGTTLRVLGQLRHDRRSMGLLIGAPLLLLTLVYFMFDGNDMLRDRVLLIMLGIFPFLLMFLVTSIAMLRERTSGTLERLFTTPMGKLDLLFAYGLAFGLAATVQASVATTVAYWLLGLETEGGGFFVVLIAVGNALLGVGLGLLCSAFARTEFQAVQFLPIVVLPQILLSGLFVPRPAMAGWLEGLSNVMPLAHGVEALQEVGMHASATADMWRGFGVVVGCVLLALTLAAGTLRRRTE